MPGAERPAHLAWRRDLAHAVPPAGAGAARAPGRPVVTLVSTYLLGLSSALLVVLSIDVLILGVDAASGTPPWAVALAAALGQVTGKTFYYLLGSGVVARVPSLHLRRRRPGSAGSEAAPLSPRRARAALRLAALQAWAAARPWGPAALILWSAAVGLPPFAATSVVAGALRMPLWLFWVTGVAGRFLRFLAILGAGGELLTRWLG